MCRPTATSCPVLKISVHVGIIVSEFISLKGTTLLSQRASQSQRSECQIEQSSLVDGAVLRINLLTWKNNFTFDIVLKVLI